MGFWRPRAYQPFWGFLALAALAKRSHEFVSSTLPENPSKAPHSKNLFRSDVRGIGGPSFAAVAQGLGFRVLPPIGLMAKTLPDGVRLGSGFRGLLYPA